MLMVLPNQASSLQGSRCVSNDILSANDPGTGSGWQQSKQNWVLPAVVGYWVRMQCNDPCSVQSAQLHPYCYLLTVARKNECWAEARIKIARMTLTIKLDGNWSSFQLANSAPPLSVTDSAIAPSARMTTQAWMISLDICTLQRQNVLTYCLNSLEQDTCHTQLMDNPPHRRALSQLEPRAPQKLRKSH